MNEKEKPLFLAAKRCVGREQTAVAQQCFAPAGADIEGQALLRFLKFTADFQQTPGNHRHGFHRQPRSSSFSLRSDHS